MTRATDVLKKFDESIVEVVEGLEVTAKGVKIWSGGTKRDAKKSDWIKMTKTEFKSKIEDDIGETVTLVNNSPQTILAKFNDEILGVFDTDSMKGIISTSE